MIPAAGTGAAAAPDEYGVAVSVAEAPGVALIRTKVHGPIARPLVPRPALVDRLVHGPARRLTLIRGQAGWGKSSLLAAWSAADPRGFAWLALDRGEFREAMDPTVADSLDVDIAVNAPVGTGKTLAYILAALARGERIVIATSSKALQDQIVGEELPQLREDLRAIYGHELTFGVLKGKSNYACHRTARLMLDGKLPDDQEEELDLLEGEDDN